MSAAMDAIAPEPFLETQVFVHFGPHLFLHGMPTEVDGQAHRVAIRPANVKLVETDVNEFKTDAVIVVDGHEIGCIDPERKTDWHGGEWPRHWTVNVAVHPRKEFDLGVFYKNSRTNKLKSMRACAMQGRPGFILFYSNAFGDSGHSSTASQPNSKRSALLVPASAMYSPDGRDRLPVVDQVNSYGIDLPVFKVPFAQCHLVHSPQEFQGIILLQVRKFIRSQKDED